MTILRAIAIAAAMAIAAIGVWRGTWAVGGSDSSCYALMAQAFATGTLQPTSPLAVEAPWGNRSTTSAPGGFIPSPVNAAAASPVCAPGFSLLLAPLYAIGGRDAIFLATPIAGALLIYLTFAFGRQLAGEAAGLAAALVTAAAPVLIFQVVQPMNDVAVAATWMAILVFAARPVVRATWIGALTGLAILLRPNLAPASLAVAAWCLGGGIGPFARFALAAAPFLAVLLLLNAKLYGHPLQSGYGSVSDLFSLVNVATNIANYGRALSVTQLAFPLLGVTAIFLVPRDRRGVVALALSIVAAIVAVYLVYRPFPEWWYLRFLLPALALLTALAMTSVVLGSRRVSLLIPVVLMVAGYSTTSGAMREAWNLSRLEQRFRLAAVTARDRLPERAVFFTVWESGSVRYHAGRDAIVWDSLDGGALDDALSWLSARGHDPYIVIEDWEEPLFRERFAARSAIGQLDWPPRFEIERRVKIYRPADRAGYFNGDTIPTEIVRANRR